MTGTGSRRTGLLMVEALMALAVLGAVSVVVLDLVSRASAGGVDAGDTRLAVAETARVVDRLLAAGPTRIAGLEGQDRPVDPTFSLGALPLTSGGAAAWVVDGLRLSGRCHVERLEAPLIRVRVTVDWLRERRGTAAHQGTLTVVRYISGYQP